MKSQRIQRGFTPPLFSGYTQERRQWFSSLKFFSDGRFSAKGVPKGLPRTFLVQKGAGFTIMEILIYTAILSIIMSSVIALLLFVVRSNTKVQAVRATVENVKNAVNTMTNEIREATSIYDSTTSAAQLSLETAKNIPAGETSTYIDFFLCGTRLCLKRESQDPIAITTDNVEVTTLQFTEVTASSIPSLQITITVAYENPDNKPQLDASTTVTTTVSLRAY